MTNKNKGALLNMIKIEYPSGFGPENNLPLDISNSFVFDIPAGYLGEFSCYLGSGLEYAICIYSMASGSKILEEFENFSGHVPNIHNYSQTVYSYLCTGWYKDPSDGKWKQTSRLVTHCMGYTAENFFETSVHFNKVGEPNLFISLALRRINYTK
ncbi:hypothetical protein COJ51_02220 [Bacillus thuringiensis]|nr:hypothetical protein COJ51_02220 [Bacillus thuringiensis]